MNQSTETTTIHQNPLSFFESRKIPWIKQQINRYLDSNGEAKKDVDNCPSDWMNYNYDKCMEYNNNGFNGHKKQLAANIQQGNYVVLDTDDIESEKWCKQRLNGKKCPTTNSAKGRHRYIKYKGRPLKKEVGTAFPNFDFITQSIFEDVTRIMKYHDRELEMTKEELEDLLGIKLSYLTELKKGIDKNADSPAVIERYIYEKNEIIDQDKLFKMIDGLNPEKFVSYSQWQKFVIAIYNQVPNKESMDIYYEKVVDFLRKQKSYKEEYDIQNFTFFKYSLPNNKSGDTSLTGKTIWFWLKDQNIDLFKELQKKRHNLDAVEFNKIGDYIKQKKKFEEKNFKINSDKIAYIEKDTINNRDVFRSQDGLKRRYQKLTCTVKDDKGNEKEFDFLPTWLKDKYSLEYDTMDFVPPPQKANESCYNLFSGFMIDKSPPPEDWEDVDTTLIWNHLKNLAGNDDKCFDYYKMWFAHRIQYPGILPKVALVWRSKQGCGKNCFLDFIGNNIIGKEYYATSANIADYIGQFATIDKGKILCVMNEADPRDTHSNMSRIKEKFTDPFIMWESKGVDRFPIQNCAGYVLPTNCNNSIKVEADDRRIMAQVCSTDPLRDDNYFDILLPLLESAPHAYKFYQELKAVDIKGDYNFKKYRPLTEEYLKMKLYNIPNLIRFIKWMLELEDNKGKLRELEFLSVSELWTYYQGYCQNCNIPCNITQHKFIIDFANGEYSNIIEKSINPHKKTFYTIKRLEAQALVDNAFNEIEDFTSLPSTSP